MHLLAKAALMGVVEGITEFLPISSTGHLILLNQVVQIPRPFADMFEVVIQLGAILAVVIYFRDRLMPWGGDEHRRDVLSLWWKTAAGVVPALLIGGTLGRKVEEHLFNPYVVACALVAGGIVLLAVERRKRPPVIGSIREMSYRMAVAVGLIQCLAMVPGTSRSAATIIGAMLLGASRGTAAEFSFFLAIPTLAAASAYSLLKGGLHWSSAEWEALGVGFVVSFFVAWAVVAAFMRYIRNRDFTPFAWYRIALGVLVLAFFLR